MTKRRWLAVLFVYFIAVVGLLVYAYRPALVLPSNKAADDWQFVQTTYNPGFLAPVTFWGALTPKTVGLLLLILPVFFLSIITSYYILYRLVRAFFRRLKKDNAIDSKNNYQLRHVFLLFFLSVFLLGLAGYFYIWHQLLPPVLIMTPIEVSFLVFAGWFGISVLLLVILLLLSVFRKITHRVGGKLSKKAMWGVVGVGYFVFVVLPAFFIVQVLIGLFGVSLSNLSLPTLSTTGGGLPNAAIAPNAFRSGGLQLKTYDMGYSTGGAKDINNFRTNIQNNYLPIPTDITYEGLFYDYYFDSGSQQPCSELFCPTYSFAVSSDPFSKQPEYYLSVGLNSGMKKEDFQRKKLNLVIVMDISGSMGSPFDTYYYDQKGAVSENDSPDAKKTKMQIANEAVVGLLGHLRPGDRFGMVLFDDVGYLAKPVGLVENTNMELLKQHILAIREQGGTNMEAGLRVGTDLLKEFTDIDKETYENRIIFLTDAQPNTGDYSENGLLGITQKNAGNSIYSTFIGVGVDFNTELIEGISKTTGANYYAVHSSGDFKRRMDEGFDYMVTPLVFDLALKIQSPDYTIEKVYGSPEANLSTNEIMHVNTLFPSDKTEEGVKGGLVLLKLKKKAGEVAGGNITLTASYNDRAGQPHANTASAAVPQENSDYYQSSGIRKGILLTRYASLLRGWMIDENSQLQRAESFRYVPGESNHGIIIPEDRFLTQWERTSYPLTVSSAYKTAFQTFRQYFVTEGQVLKDPVLQQEVSLLDTLISK